MRFSFTKPLLSTLLVLALGLTSTQNASAAQPVSGISSTIYNEGTDKAAVFYNPVAVSNVDLTMPQQTIDALNDDFYNNTYSSAYREADVKITTADGVITTLTNIGVRLKGQATRRPINDHDKAPLKLKFDAFVPNQKFLGLTRMTLNSMAQDPSLIRENTAYRIYRAMGIVAPRTTYSWVTVNDADFGLYMNVESIDGQMLKRWLNPVHVYSSNCYLADMTYSQDDCYDTNYGDSDRTDLNAAVAVSVYDGEAWWTEVNKIADMTAVINLMATDIFTSNWDGYTDVVQNNYYIVFDNTGKLKIIPWGQDGTFPMQADAQLPWLGEGPAFRGFGNQTRSVMLRKCVAYDPCKKLLLKAHVAVKDKVATLGIPAFKNKVASVINTAYISNEVRSSPNVLDAYSLQNWLDQFFPQRTASLTTFLSELNPEAPELSVDGSALVGGTLNAIATTWDYTATLNYQWLRNSVEIPNATNAAYKITAVDIGARISVKALATKPPVTGGLTARSAEKISGGLIPKPSITLSGIAKTGNRLSIKTKTPTLSDAKFQWLRNGKVLAGATKSTYTLQSADYKTSVSAKVTISRVGYNTTSNTSPGLKVGLGELTKTPDPKIGGTPSVNSTLTARIGTWDSGVNLTYQWIRDGVNISKATGKTYRLTRADRKAEIALRVKATKLGFQSLTIDSNALTVR